VALEHLPYEEGIKTDSKKPLSKKMSQLEHLPYEEGIKTAKDTLTVFFGFVGTPTL